LRDRIALNRGAGSIGGDPLAAGAVGCGDGGCCCGNDAGGDDESAGRCDAPDGGLGDSGAGSSEIRAPSTTQLPREVPT
jgi:hypothetical protein